MFSNISDHSKGLLLAAFGGMLLTIDIPLVMLGQGEPWSVMLLRSAAVLLTAFVYLALRSIGSGRIVNPMPGPAGLATAMCYGTGAVFFLLSIYHTSTANLVFILSFNPMFAALLSWLFLGERPRQATLAAMAAMIAGVLIIVHDGLGHGHLLGDLFALLTSFSLASAITLTRASGRDMSMTPLIGSLAPFLAAGFMVGQNGFRIDFPWWILLDGLVVLPLSFFCLARAPKYLPGPEVAMFYLLETILTPVWVWMVFSHIPSKQSMIGGTILIVTLMSHSLWQVRRVRQSTGWEQVAK